MGNCQHGRPATWADDDYEEEEEEMIREISEKKMKMEPVIKEVKIKITKKQLEELLHKAEMQGLPLQQALMVLMSVGNVVGAPENGKHWRPALQSIPEVAE
ncbi:TerB-like protein [Dioscorea alata]|uniref:TerB-like protein n=1 Tax=Dioscorea alata TaxID=55571 RepID=A0ACB7UNK2_DIOAL|nr:TerB-like protein [Dioscorea alata]